MVTGVHSVGSQWSPHSGIGLATSDNGLLQGTLASGTATDFSLYYVKAYDASTVHVELWLNGALQASSSNLTQVDFATNHLTMPGVEFDTFKVIETDLQYPGYYAIDDVSFTTNAVPEPASMAALGLGGLALLRRRRRA